MSQRIEGTWRRQLGGTAGWHVEVIDISDGSVVTDSEKVSFPINVDRFGEYQGAELQAALIAEYGDYAVIEVEGEL